MAWDLELLQVTSPSLAYIVLGGFVVAFSMISLLIKEKLYISEVVLGTAFGVLMGPHCANIFDPRSWGDRTQEITLEVMRIVLATGLFAIGVELPQSYLADHAKGLLVMVVPTMAFGWVVVAVVIYGLFEPMNYISALAVAACLTPTDPIICAAIVGGRYAIKHVPTNLRRILAAESAANDGMAYPFLSISIYLTVETSRRVAIAKWFLVGWLYEVVLGTLIGTFLGIAFSKLMRISHRRGYIDRESYVAQYLALALFTIGVASSLGTDDLLAAFAAGSALSWDGYFNIQTENEVFSSVIDLLLNCACFVYIGAWMPFASFNSPELGITPWRLIVLFFVILLVRRIPAMLVLYRWIPEISGWREALFSGHFGPMGVGAVFVSTLALSRLPEPHSPPQNQQEYLAATLQTIVAFIVLGSILIHGLSIPFFSFGRRIHSQTVSLTRTLTSRNNTMGNTLPEWLMGTRRMPPYEVSGAGPDVEAARTGDHKSGAPTPHMAQDADVLVVSQGVEEGQEGRVPHFGEASFLEEPPRTRESSLRRRTTGMEALPVGSPNGLVTNETGTAPAAGADRPQIMPDTLDGENLPIAFKARIESVEDHNAGDGDDKPPSGVQTPVKAVHFPPTQ